MKQEPESLVDFLNYHNRLEDFYFIWGEIEDGKETLEDYKQNPEKYEPEEIQIVKNSLEDLGKVMEIYKAKYQECNPQANWEKELEEFREYVSDPDQYMERVKADRETAPEEIPIRKKTTPFISQGKSK